MENLPKYWNYKTCLIICVIMAKEFHEICGIITLRFLQSYGITGTNFRAKWKTPKLVPRNTIN